MFATSEQQLWGFPRVSTTSLLFFLYVRSECHHEAGSVTQKEKSHSQPAAAYT